MDLPGFREETSLAGPGLEEVFGAGAGNSLVLAVLFISVMPTLSVFLDVPLAQKLEGSLLKTYKQDDCPKKIFLAYRGRYLVVLVCKT